MAAEPPPMADVFARLTSETTQVLAGPILRRAEPHRVCIWIACNRPFRLIGEVYPVEIVSKQLRIAGVVPDAIGLSEETHSIQLGAHLHVALAQITPRREPQSLRSGSKQFPVDTLLAYDVLLFESSAVTANVSGKRLKDFQLIDGPNAVNYPGSGLPTFFLRSRSLPLNLLYGSCRKLHGPENDCLALADEMIDETLADLKARPSVLFLTGDQIYADDVAGPLIKHLTGLGNELLQWDEEESVPGMPKSSTIDVYQRQKLIERPGPAMFTSDYGHNHLLTFGEFAAMYLVAWNGQNWPESYPEYGGDREHNAQYREEIENLELARRTMPAVRRALANIPSYMIFDDHEITDDWNITRDWYEAVKKSPAGHRVVANGLAAFLMFQAWGNEPEMFAPRNRITSYFASNGQDPKAFEDDLWGFTGWTFVAPTDPPTVFIDTRTQRQYDTDSGPARLLSDAGINLLKKHSPKSDGRPLLLVSPAPLYGFDRMERYNLFCSKLSAMRTSGILRRGELTIAASWISSR